MASREKVAEAGTARGRRILFNLGDELRRARQTHGLSQANVGRAADISASEVCRIEHGRREGLSIVLAARLLAVVGLELGARAFPRGTPIRDAAHRALLDRLRGRTSKTLRWAYEVPLPIAGDPRGWDATVGTVDERAGVEAETQPRDIQEVQRRVALKLRDDDRVSFVILLLADTRTNRRIVREHADALRASFPISSDEAFRALAEGRLPAGNALILV